VSRCPNYKKSSKKQKFLQRAVGVLIDKLRPDVPVFVEVVNGKIAHLQKKNSEKSVSCPNYNSNYWGKY
jgi:hypothetical protein